MLPGMLLMATRDGSKNNEGIITFENKIDRHEFN